jgi:hypothetical protein
MTAPKDFETLFADLMTRDEAITQEWFDLAASLMEFAKRRKDVRLLMRPSEWMPPAIEDEPDKPIPEGIKPRRKPQAVDGLSNEAGERVAKAVAAALDDAAEVSRADAA